MHCEGKRTKLAMTAFHTGEHSMTTRFDPNESAPKAKAHHKQYDWLWATYIPGRQPQFKIHGSCGLATSALKCRYYWSKEAYRLSDSQIALFKRDSIEGKWIEVPIKKHYKGKENILESN